MKAAWSLLIKGCLRLNMAIKTFEYCSLFYLNQWLEHDMGFCDALAKGNRSKKLDTLRKAANFYRVARNLPSKYEGDLKRYELVLDIIDSLKPADFKKDPIEEIYKIKDKISDKYGKRGVLSLTTKFLWIKFKEPILIYDSQASMALGIKSEGLSSYYKKWREEFKDNKTAIVDACSKLPDMYKYAANQETGTKEYIDEIASATWFHERVFDAYLWHKGKNA